MSAHTALEMPALNGDVVTQAHANICAERGHATHKVNGEIQPHCPRCGEALAEETPVATFEVVPYFKARGRTVGYEVRRVTATGTESLCKWANETEAEAHIAHLKSINY